MPETILVIDDDADMRDFLALLLGSEGYAAEVAENGLAALRVLHAHQGRGALPVLILLDLSMPEMNGPEFRAAQLKDPALRDIPILVLSGDVDGQEQAEGLGAAYLRKPFRLERLLAAVIRCKRPAAATSLTRSAAR